MPRITVLPESVANKIAAGEVVERPASVVKELMENAIDAGATHITVSLTAGGKRSIVLSDDGCGMTRDDAILAFERHATSKVTSAADLDRIETLGFRGEALPSVAAVSKVVLVTRPAESLAGTRVVLAGGVLKDVSEVGAPTGTRVTARNLYFNTPARAKFLKSTPTELGHCVEVVQRHALAHDDIGFKLSHNGKYLFDIPAGCSLADRVALIWGAKLAAGMVDVDRKRDGVRVTGLVGRPSLYRAQKNMQLFFLNRRPIANRAFTRAVAAAYSGLLPTGKFPVAILFVEVDPAEVDINVHPAKREVRFKRERDVYNAVVYAVRSALEAGTTEVRGAAAQAQIRDEPPPRQGGEVKVQVEPTIERVKRVPVTTPPADLAVEQPWQEPEEEVERPSESATSAETTPEEPVDELAATPLFSPDMDPTEAPLQVFGTYLVAPQHDRLLIIDQHALHERVTYEKLKRELERKQLSMQRLLVPITIEFTPAQAKLIGECLPLLEGIGIEMESFGGSSFIVTVICELISASKVEDLLRHVVAELEQGDLLEDEQKLKERLLVLTVAACRSSIKAGEPLTIEQRRELLAALRQLSPPYTCPHGRPIMTELTLDQLERSFKRR